MDTDREQVLETLHEAAMEIQRCRTVREACERTVAAAESILEFEMCTIVLHEDGWLVPVAVSEEAPVDGARRMAADEGLAGRTFQTGESYLVDDVTEDATSEPAKDVYLSGLSVPIGDVGVFQAVAPEREAFDESDVDLAELLVSHTAGAVDRLQFTEELRQQQIQLERQNERLDRFASVVSHDLRNPLNVATGRLELAKDECDSDHLEGVESALGRMDTLIDDLLTLAREGRPIEDTEPVTLETVARQSWGTAASEHGTLVVETDAVVEADRGRLRQLFENLFANAVEHGPPDGATERSGEERDDGTGEKDSGELTVVVDDLDNGVPPSEGEGGDVNASQNGNTSGKANGDGSDAPDGATTGFYVADDGQGLEDEDADVFEWGYSTADGGTGYGLAIVEEIAKAHGWEVAATESWAGGARFEFRGVRPPDEAPED